MKNVYNNKYNNKMSIESSTSTTTSTTSNTDANPQQSIPFYRGRKKDVIEKLENIQAWIRGVSCDNKRGFWSFVYLNGKNELSSIYGSEENTDINRIDLIPLLELLEWIDENDKKKNLIVYTKSSYVVNCVNEWIDKWKRSDFHINDDESSYRPNTDILRRIDMLKKNINITVKLIMVENELSLKTVSLCEKEQN